jgi:exopolysaccharide biosynthesis polyprenyl glycosylphosphotransferase
VPNRWTPHPTIGEPVLVGPGQLRSQVGAGPSRRDAAVRRSLVVADAGAFIGAAAVSLAAADPDGRFPDQFLWALALVPLWVVLLKVYGCYDRDARRVGHSTVDDLPSLFHVTLLTGLAVWLWLKVALPESMTLAQGATLVVSTPLLALLARTGARRVTRSVMGPERVLLVGQGAPAGLLVRKVLHHPEYGLRVVGYLAGDRGRDEPLGEDLPLLGDAEDLEAVCRRHRIERVIVVAFSVGPEALTRLIRAAHDSGVKVSVLPHAFDVLGPATELGDVEGVTVLGINPPTLSRSSRALKRSLDIAVSLPLAAATLLIFPLVAALIKLDSPGPVLYGQERIGRGGRTFRLYKFRTMVRDAEDRLDELRAGSAHSAWLLIDDDPRVTRVGRVLRKLSIDELPQLWNVLRGEMSLVGPRPMSVEVHAHIGGWGLRRLDLTPGLTGMWQVLGRTWIPFEEMITLDYLYVTNWSLWGDVRLLLKTLYIVLSGRGAN